MNDQSSSSQCTLSEPHHVSSVPYYAESSTSSNEEDLFFLWNKPPTSDTRLFAFYDTVQVRTAIHSTKRQSATTLSLHPPSSANDHFTPKASDNGGVVKNTPKSLTNSASTHLCSGIVYELTIGSKVLIASGDSLPFVGEIISLFQNKKSGKMQFKVRWFWYKSDIDRENSKILRRFEKYPFQNIDLSQHFDSESLQHVEKIFSNGSPLEVFYSTATDVNDLETILRPCYVLFIDDQNSQSIASSGNKGASSDSDRDRLPSRDAYLCRYEYIVKEQKLVPISKVKSLDEAQRLADTVATMLRVISYWDLTDKEAHARFKDNPKAWVDLQLSIEFANAEETKKEEKRLRKARFALVKSWLGMSYDELRAYLVSVRSTAQQQQLLVSSSSPSKLPSDPLLEQQQLGISIDDSKMETSQEKIDDDQNSIDWIKPSQTDDFGHVLMYDVAGVVPLPQASQLSHREESSINFNSSSYNGVSSSGRDSIADNETLPLGIDHWPISPSPKNGDNSLNQVNSPYLKDKKEEKKVNQIREGAAYQARIPSLASTALHLMLQLSSATEKEVLYWEDDEPKNSFEDGKVWSPIRNEAKVVRFLSEATAMVEQLKADYLARFRKKAAQGHSAPSGESAGFSSLEATLRSEELISDSIRIDGSFILIHGDLEEILLTILFECGYNEAAAKEALEKRIPQYFVPWSYAEHVKLVKGSERTKGRTILNSYVKLRSTKNRRQLLDYYFRYVRSAVKLPFETSTRLLSDSAVVTTRVIPAGFADNHIIDFEIDLLKYNMLTDFLVRLRKSVDEVSYMEIVNSIVEFLQGLETASAMIIRTKLVLLRSYLRAAVDVSGEDRQVTESPPYDSVQQIFSDFSLFVPVFVSHDELQMYFFKRNSIHNFI